ncbi:YcgL domain-containing protein [Paraneptunicella aestuarii]|uniref:YcgL domain-containing protein n=1 Tax=Paraneptunicella aestuarii TaxID=2831148 RepID=UPI001E3BD1A7|nr:YcgL domain-containing protein [Paraneptunicella aestuarii]UAA39816.1 YcgL domain-containing protein [Paraneptunicella aestuarii]
MLCSVYKSPKRSETYLYIEKRDDFSRVPEALMQTFGKPVHVLSLALKPERQLAGADVELVKSDLLEKGFYLQLPKQEENMLEMHKAMQKAEQAFEEAQQQAQEAQQQSRAN